MMKNAFRKTLIAGGLATLFASSAWAQYSAAR